MKKSLKIKKSARSINDFRKDAAANSADPKTKTSKLEETEIEKLRASEERYKKLIETEPECVKILSKDNILLDMNPAGLAMIEADSIEQVAGKSILGVIEPEYQKVFADVTKKVFRGETASAEFKVVGLKGGKRWLETHAAPLRDEKGKINSLLAVTRDITDRKKAEQELREKEYFFRESQRVGFIGSYKMDLATGRWESSEVLDSIFGIDKNYDRSVAGWLAIVHPDDREMMDRYFKEEVIGKHKQFNKKYRIIRKSDGKVRWLSGLGQLISDASGNVVSMIGTINDVTEQTKIEEALNSRISELEGLKISLINLVEELGEKDAALEEEKSKYEVLLGNIMDGVMAINTDKIIIYVNDEIVRLVGIGKEQLLGSRYFEMWDLQIYGSGDNLPEAERPVNLALAGEKKKILKKYSLVRRDGRKIPVSISVGPIRVGGKMTGANVIMRDITQETEIDRAKDEFISVASHQLRTPLSSMKWLIEALQGSKNLKSNDETKLKNLLISTERLITLVNDLLSISRMESGKFLGERKLSNIVDLLKTAVKDFEIEASKTNKKIVLSVPKSAGKIYCNPMLVLEAFNNILANAIIYGKNDSTVTVKLAVADGAYLVSVNNFDHFIPKEDSDKIFTKFFRAPSAMLIKPEGSGLGLYISKAGIEKNGGRIWFESNEKDGTTFYFTVPISKE